MPVKRISFVIAALVLLFAGASANAQLLPDPFRYDLTTFFAGPDGKTWVGEATMFKSHYTDTVHVRYDAVESALFIRRTLVDDDEGDVVSFGIGLISIGESDSLHAVRWTEKNYPEAEGRMFWDPEYSHWRVNFDGRWKQWFINIRNAGDSAFEAGVARKVGSFPAVELLNATYRAIED